ncbi:MAG: hypothetical protein AB7H92_15595 [Microbacteriaceae bacterium]
MTGQTWDILLDASKANVEWHHEQMLAAMAQLAEAIVADEALRSAHEAATAFVIVRASA